MFARRICSCLAYLALPHTWNTKLYEHALNRHTWRKFAFISSLLDEIHNQSVSLQGKKKNSGIDTEIDIFVYHVA